MPACRVHSISTMTAVTYPDTEGHVVADERSAATMIQEIEFAPDFPAGGSRIRTLGPRSRSVDSFGEMGTVTGVTDRRFQSPTPTLESEAASLRTRLGK
jgi:hypothetical protein